MSTIRISTDGSTMVDDSHHWIPVGDSQPKFGTKALLINIADGVAIIDRWYHSDYWTHWAPLPTFNKDEAR